VLVAVTLALVRTAPELSATRPCNEAVMVWLKAPGHSNKMSDNLTAIMAKRVCIAIPPSRDQKYITHRKDWQDI
jgi:hypothetical protein